MFSSLTEAQLRNKLDLAGGIFIAESPKVIRVALDAGMEPLALLCERRHIEGDAADIVSRLPQAVPVLEGESEFCIFYCGWDATEKRAHACALSLCYFSGKNPNGKPAWHQKIYDSTLNGNTGYRSWAYGVEGHSIEDSTRLGNRVIHVPSASFIPRPFPRKVT